jgi:hypothetical protein
MRTAVAVAAAVVVVLFSPPAQAKPAVPPGLASWAPTDVVGGSWQLSQEADVDPLSLSGDRICEGRRREWSAADSHRSVVVRWYTCASNDMTSWTARFEDVRRGVPPAPLHTVTLGAQNEIVVVGSTSVGWVWLQDRYVVNVDLECDDGASATCLETAGRLAVDISRRLPGEPVKLAGGRPQQTASFLVSLLVVWALVVGGVTAWRRLRRESFASAPTDRSFPVEQAARALRRKARQRRAGAALLFPVLGFIAASAPGVPAGAFDAAAFSTLFVLTLLFGVPAAVLLYRSRGAMSGLDWRWHGAAHTRRGRPGRRALSMLLGGLSLVLLVLVLLTGALAVGADRLTGGPPVLVTLASPFMIASIIFLWLVSRAARRRATRDAWRALNSRSGSPIVLLRGFGESNGRLRVADIPAPGPAAWLRRILRPQGQRRFDEALSGMLARYGPISTLDMPGERLPDPPTRRLALPADHWRDLLAAITADAVGVVIAPTRWSGAGAAALDILVSPVAAGRLMLVLPPLPRDELAGLQAAVLAGATDDSLAKAWAVDGTLVLVHVPDHGWFGWSARQHDEWSYVQALHDGLVFATKRWPQPADRSAVAGLASDARRASVPRVLMLAGPADDAMATYLAAQLSGMGVEAVRDSRPAAVDGGFTAVVAVLTDSALRDPDWRAESARWADADVRLVPVMCGELSIEAPPTVQALNWVIWTPAEPAAASAKIFAAVNSRMSNYLIHRDLSAQARAWLAANRAEGQLIGDHRRAVAAEAHIAVAANDPLARPSELVRQYVHASVAATRRRRFRIRGWVLGGVAAILAAAVLVAYAVQVIQTQRKNNRIVASITGLPILDVGRPDRVALLAGAAIVQGSAEQARIGRTVLRRTLGQSWPRTRLGALHDAPFADAAITGDDDVLTVDRLGTVTSWRRSTESVRWRYRVDADATALGAAPDGAIAAVAAGRSVHLLRLDPWRRQTQDAGADVSRVAVAAAADLVVAATSDGRVLASRISSFDPFRSVVSTGKVLDLRASEGGRWVRALVRTQADTVDLIDVGSGAVLRSWRVALSALAPVGAIGADGTSAALIDLVGNVRYAPATGDPQPTGQRALEPTSDLVLSPQGEIVVVSQQFGVTAIDPGLGIVTARLNETQTGVFAARAAEDGATLVCVSASGVYVWSTDAFAPTIAAPQSPPVGQMRSSVGELSAEGGADGVVTVDLGKAGRQRVGAGTGAVTSVAVRADGTSVLAGTAHGEVVEFDPRYREIVRRWQAPDHAAVSAVGWSIARPDRIVVQTRGSVWWEVPGCPGCGASATLIAALRPRLFGCYLDENLDLLTPRSRAELGVRVCRESPAAQEG